jgi:acetyl esterase/lipase
MVAIQIEYRLLKGGTTDPPAVCIQDAKSAMRWVRKRAAQFGIDPNRIAAGGGSAGGHVAAFLGLMQGIDDPADDSTISARPDALVLFNPVLDNGPEGWGYSRTGAYYMKYSPFHHVQAKAPPTIILSGANDKLIPAATLTTFRDAMRKSGVRCELTIYPGQEHGFFNYGKSYYETLKAADEFLTSLGWLHGPPTLKPESAPARPARKKAN